MNVEFTFSNNELAINKCIVRFSYPIRDAKVFDENIIVLLAIPYNEDTIDNLYSINIQGEIVWRSQYLKGLYPTEKLLPYEQMIIEEQWIIASDFYGRRYFLNAKNGNIMKRDITK